MIPVSLLDPIDLVRRNLHLLDHVAFYLTGRPSLVDVQIPYQRGDARSSPLASNSSHSSPVNSSASTICGSGASWRRFVALIEESQPHRRQYATSSWQSWGSPPPAAVPRPWRGCTRLRVFPSASSSIALHRARV